MVVSRKKTTWVLYIFFCLRVIFIFGEGFIMGEGDMMLVIENV